LSFLYNIFIQCLYFYFSGFKDLQSRKSTAFLKFPTRDEVKSQVRFRQQEESENEEEKQKESVEETHKLVEAETKEFDDNVQQNVLEIQETQLERWKDAIMKYIQDSKALRVKEEQVKIKSSFGSKKL
jgi:hypothetical protein